MSRVKERFNKIVAKLNPKFIMAVATLQSMSVMNMMTVHADSNTNSIDTFIDFALDWIAKIGGVVALVGGVMFALSWQRDDAEGKSRALMTLMAGFMLVAISMSKSIFGL